jgi:hypothetical protein
MNTLYFDLLNSLTMYLSEAEMKNINKISEMRDNMKKYWRHKIECLTKKKIGNFNDTLMDIYFIMKSKWHSRKSLLFNLENLCLFAVDSNNRLLLEVLQSIGAVGDMALMKSCFGDGTLTKELLKTANPSISGEYCIKWACANGNIKSVKELMKDGRVDLTVENGYCLIWASRMNRIDIVKLLLTEEKMRNKCFLKKAAEKALEKNNMEILVLLGEI